MRPLNTLPPLQAGPAFFYKPRVPLTLHPGIVGSYQLSLGVVKWRGLPESITILPGRQVCRMALLEELNVFGNPMSTLYRSDLLRICEIGAICGSNCRVDAF
jgi:hypothetical protein